MTGHRNQTIVTEVLVVGFQNLNEYRIPLFLLLLIMYTFTCIENILIISLVWKNPRLHSPMYIMISNLFLCDFIYTADMDPSALYNILSGRGAITLIGCIFQMNIVIAFSVFEIFLLTLMSIDRYLAICHPLRYSALMHNRLCLYLIIVLWLIAILIVSFLMYIFVSLKYCGPITVDYFFCEYTVFLGAMCVMSDTRALVVYSRMVGYSLNVPFVFIVFSYIFIIISVLRIKSSAGRQKAFSTCGSHLLVVALYFGIPFISYLVPISVDVYNGLSFIYYLVLPMLNPIIYSLRNKDIHKALKTFISGIKQNGAN